MIVAQHDTMPSSGNGVISGHAEPSAVSALHTYQPVHEYLGLVVRPAFVMHCNIYICDIMKGMQVGSTSFVAIVADASYTRAHCQVGMHRKIAFIGAARHIFQFSAQACTIARPYAELI